MWRNWGNTLPYCAKCCPKPRNYVCNTDAVDDILIPAVPCDDASYYGALSIPDRLVKWWVGLPEAYSTFKYVLKHWIRQEKV